MIDDRPNAGGEGAGDEDREFEWLPGFDSTLFNASVNYPPLSSMLRLEVETDGKHDLIPFLESIPIKFRKEGLSFLMDLEREEYRKLYAARRFARKLLKVGNQIGSDTLPACLALAGFQRSNNFTRSLLVASLVCAWPGEFRDKVNLRHPVAIALIRSRWRPALQSSTGKGRRP